jgi:hypothetical protein
VFDDLYWQHLAFEKGGVALLKKINANAGGNLLPKNVIDAWTLIEDGEKQKDKDKGKGMIKKGNLELLLHEQSIIVQKYAFDSFGAKAFGVIGNPRADSPIPGGRPFPRNKMIASSKHRLEWMPTVMDDFAWFKNSANGKKQIVEDLQEWIADANKLRKK